MQLHGGSGGEGEEILGASFMLQITATCIRLLIEHDLNFFWR